MEWEACLAFLRPAVRIAGVPPDLRMNRQAAMTS